MPLDLEWVTDAIVIATLDSEGPSIPRDRARIIARAAIMAIREPSDGMLLASLGEDALIRDRYRAMIDEVLGKPRQPFKMRE
jgi:hypothetical protein